MRWELFVAMLRDFYDGMDMTIAGLALTHADVKSLFVPWARDIMADPTGAGKVSSLLAAKDAQVQQSLWIDTFIKPLLQHLAEHKSLHKFCSVALHQCRVASSKNTQS